MDSTVVTLMLLGNVSILKLETIVTEIRAALMPVLCPFFILK